MKFRFTENIDSPYVFGRLVDLNGRPVNRDGTPVEPWFIDLCKRLADNAPHKSKREKPNIKKLRDFLRFAAEIERVTGISGDDILAEVDRALGCIDIIIEMGSISFSFDGIDVAEFMALADNVAVGASTDGTVYMTASFYHFFVEED